MSLALDVDAQLDALLGDRDPDLRSHLRASTALALDREGHVSPCGGAATIEKHPELLDIRWRAHPDAPHALALRDEHRITEDGAEGLALAFASSMEIHALRRMKRGTFVDWLLRDSEGREMGCEIAGTRKERLEALLARERDQATRAALSHVVVCVVRFEGTPSLMWERVR